MSLKEWAEKQEITRADVEDYFKSMSFEELRGLCAEFGCGIDEIEERVYKYLGI